MKDHLNDAETTLFSHCFLMKDHLSDAETTLFSHCFLMKDHLSDAETTLFSHCFLMKDHLSDAETTLFSHRFLMKDHLSDRPPSFHTAFYFLNLFPSYFHVSEMITEESLFLDNFSLTFRRDFTALAVTTGGGGGGYLFMIVYILQPRYCDIMIHIIYKEKKNATAKKKYKK